MRGLVVFAVVVFAVLIIISIPVRIGVRLKARTGFTLINLKLGICAGLIPLNFDFRAVYSRGEGLYFARVLKNGTIKKILYPGKKQKPKKKIPGLFKAFVSSIKIERFDLFGKIGTGDAFISVMLCGMLSVILNESLTAVNLKQNKRAISVLPDFDFAHFILNLECIFGLSITKIILNILSGNLKKGR